jgi:hypothetical protein
VLNSEMMASAPLDAKSATSSSMPKMEVPGPFLLLLLRCARARISRARPNQARACIRGGSYSPIGKKLS